MISLLKQWVFPKAFLCNLFQLHNQHSNNALVKTTQKLLSARSIYYSTKIGWVQQGKSFVQISKSC